MQQYLGRWKSFLNESKIIKEMYHIESLFLPEDFIAKLPKQVRQKVLEVEAIDFAFEHYKDIFGSPLNPVFPNKFFVPLVDGTEQFFDFSYDHEPETVVRNPTAKELSERGKSIPVLPKEWYNAFFDRIGEPMLHTEKKQIKQKRDLAKVKTLAVFDFDETLFQSDKAAKEQPNVHPLSPESLPENPKDSDWNLEIVYKAQELCSNPNVYCVMMTGRIGEVFKDRVDRLLLNRNLIFAETHYNDFGGDTAEYKINTIRNIIDKLPNVQQLTMWEDQPEKAEQYYNVFADTINFSIHMVDKDGKVLNK